MNDRDDEAEPNTAASFVAKQIKLGKKSNRLIRETSPYLLQHAFNPVDWFSWGEEAFLKAKQEGKPVFLSIGYSTCHWCHVMERESFENTAIAAILNKYFVSIKVDREERPDIDRIYMDVAQAMTGSGGWPLTVFLTPDKKPFYAGTYFPPVSKYGQPGFPELLHGINDAWKTQKGNIINQADMIMAAVSSSQEEKTHGESLTDYPLQLGYEQLKQTYDAIAGGFDTGAKFPRPVTFNFLLRYYQRSNNHLALEMVVHTLRKMATGGIRDHIGGGFHRYTVDNNWRVPHFEKMLYDQAQLAITYIEAYQLTSDPLFAEVAEEIFSYIFRNMTDGNGAFYSAEDADSPIAEDPQQNGEGAFYVWTKQEIESVLYNKQSEIFSYFYGIDRPGNVNHDPHGEFEGKNIPYLAHDIDETAVLFNKDAEQIKTIISRAREKLFAVRDKRPRPHLDDKIITSWNGLMISALCKGATVLRKNEYLLAAEKAASFILTTLYDSDRKVLLRRYRAGNAGIDGMLDDYANLTQGLLDLFEATQDTVWLSKALMLAERQISIFTDPAGGFFESVNPNDELPINTKSDFEGAEPSGNSIAAINLIRLARIVNNEDYATKAWGAINSHKYHLTKMPAAIPQMLAALDYHLTKPKQIIIIGKSSDIIMARMLIEVRKRFLPTTFLLAVNLGKNRKDLLALVPFLEWYDLKNDKPTAYVCENFICKTPVNDPEALGNMLA